MPDTDIDQAAVHTTATMIRDVAGPTDHPEYAARARSCALGAVISADRIARSDTAFRQEVRIILAAFASATVEPPS